METPTFTAYNSATEPFRLDRLRIVWGYTVALADCYERAWKSPEGDRSTNVEHENR